MTEWAGISGMSDCEWNDMCMQFEWNTISLSCLHARIPAYLNAVPHLHGMMHKITTGSPDKFVNISGGCCYCFITFCCLVNMDK
jgi:hypothetical protein